MSSCLQQFWTPLELSGHKHQARLPCSPGLAVNGRMGRLSSFELFHKPVCGAAVKGLSMQRNNFVGLKSALSDCNWQLLPRLERPLHQSFPMPAHVGPMHLLLRCSVSEVLNSKYCYVCQAITKDGLEEGCLPEDVRASIWRSKLALSFAHNAMQCILSRAPSGTPPPSPAASRAVALLQGPPLKFVQCFAITPLPLPRCLRSSPPKPPYMAYTGSY
jgi:hypothetical protein